MCQINPRTIVAVAITLLSLFVTTVFAQQNPSEIFERARMLDESNQNLSEAIKLYGQVVNQANEQRALAARALYRIGVLYDRLGRKADAQRNYQAVVNNYADQAVASQARARIVKPSPPSKNNSAAKVMPPKGLAVRRVWSRPKDVLGSVSPDGERVSYVHWESGNLAVYDIEAEKTQTVTKDGTWNWPNQYAYESIWSPDGRKLAYAWAKGNRGELRIVGLNDSAPQVLYSSDDISHVRPDTWSQDGKSILALLTRQDRTSQIVLVNVADGSVRVLKSLDWRYPIRMSLSHDGRYLLYDTLPNQDSPQRDIYLLSTDGSREIALVEHPATDYAPMWMPDGKSFLFGSDRTGAVGLYSLQIDNGKPVGSPRLIQRDMNRMLPMGLSRDGSYYFARATLPYQNTGDIFVATLDPKTWNLISPPEKVTKRFEGVNTLPAWSPDGKRLAYLSQRGPLPYGWGSEVLVIRSIETEEERLLSPKLARLSVPLHNPLRWSPDGRSILVVGRDLKGSQGVFLIDTETGLVNPVVRSAPGSELVRSASWSKDGKKIVYVKQVTGEGNSSLVSALIERDLESGEEKTLLRPSARPFAVSPDGQRIATCCLGGEIRLLSLSGGDRTTLFKRANDQWINADMAGFEWSPDGQSIFLPFRKPNKTELWEVSVQTGQARKTGLEMDGSENLFRTFTVHPDGRQVAFTSSAAAPAEIWVMENFLPAMHSRKAAASRR